MDSPLPSNAMLAAIDAEPELPGDLPAQVWCMIRDMVLGGDSEGIAELLRITVRETKKGIRERVLSLPESSHEPTPVTGADESATFHRWWDKEIRESFVAAYGHDEPFEKHPGWGRGHMKYAKDGWMARAALSRASEPPTEDREDAAKWRALRNCARITAMGSAGCEPGGESFAGPTAHVTLNFWTHGEPERETWHRGWLDTFVTKALRLSETKEPAPVEPPPPGCERWWHLKPYGYAPGGYIIRCHTCKQQAWNCDKRALNCEVCATKAFRAANVNPDGSLACTAGETSNAREMLDIPQFLRKGND